MNDYLEKFRAPRSWLDLAPGAVIVLVMLAVFVALDRWSAAIEATSAQETSAAQAAQAGAAGRTLPLAHPLGCPEEDEAGRKLRATVSIMGELRPRCVYGARVVRK